MQANDNSKNLSIGVLSITATVLFVGVIVTMMIPASPAMGFGQLDRGGDYVVFTGQFTQNSELVYVLDAAAKRLNAYSYEPSTRSLRLWDRIELGGVSQRN